MEPSSSFDPGRWAGQYQGSVTMAASCHAAEAHALKKARDTNHPAAVGLTWEQYCDQYFGRSRAQADRMIRHFEKFGIAYFLLTGLAGIGHRSFHDLNLAARLDGNRFLFDGRSIELAPENAPFLHAAVQTLRDERKRMSQITPVVPPAQPVAQTAGSARPAKATAAPDEINSLLDDWHRAALTGDHDRFFSCLAENFRYLGITPDGRYSLAQYRQWASEDPDKPILFSTPRDRHIEFSPDGCLATFDELLDAPGSPTFRGSGTLYRLHDAWKIVQFNYCVPLPLPVLAEATERILAETT